jgi:hypothetical protein
MASWCHGFVGSSLAPIFAALFSELSTTFISKGKPPVLIKDHRDIEHASAELDLVSSAGKETSP